MKNKKSKIIIPAMGLILLSTAASISGSVAWFTANRTANFSAGTFAVVKTSENLIYDLTAGPNTTVDATDPKHELIQFSDANALTHGAFDHKNTNVLKAAEDGNSITGYYALESTSSPALNDLKVTDIRNQLGADIGDVYAAATWQVDFKLTFGQNKKNVGLFIDWDKTYMAKPVTVSGHTDNDPSIALYTTAALTTPVAKSAANYYQYIAIGGEDKTGWHPDPECQTNVATESLVAGTTYYKESYAAGNYFAAPTATGKGFRIAFTPIGTNNTYGKTKVLAKQQSTANAKYVYVASPSVASDYTAVMNSGTGYEANDHDLLASDTAAGSILTLTDYEADSKDTTEALAYNNYLGLFPFTANTEVTLSFMCVAWYEGTDPEIQNRATAEQYEKMTAELAFEAINLADA